MSPERDSVHEEDSHSERRYRIQSQFEGRELEKVRLSNGLDTLTLSLSREG